MALATDKWGAVLAQPASHDVCVDKQVENWAASKCNYMGKRHGKEKLPMGDCE